MIPSGGFQSLAWISLASGSLTVTEVPRERLESELERLQPAEILAVHELEVALSPAPAMKRLDPWQFDATIAARESRGGIGIEHAQRSGFVLK